MENHIVTSEGEAQPDASAPETLDIAAAIAQMRAAGRTDLIHYAGAAHRDRVAWHVCREYLADPSAGEWTLKSRALKAAS